MFYLALCSALQQLFVSTAWKPQNHKNCTGTNPPAIFFPSQTSFSIQLFSQSAVCLRVSLVTLCAAFWRICLALRQLWSIERSSRTKDSRCRSTNTYCKAQLRPFFRFMLVKLVWYLYHYALSRTLDIQRRRTHITNEWEKAQSAIWRNKSCLWNKIANR